MKTLKKRSVAFVAITTCILFVGLSVGNRAFAVPIVFNMGYGGTVSYAGGATPFTTTDGVVKSVSNGTTTLPIAGGDLDFSTGGYFGGYSTSSTTFVNQYAAGGNVRIGSGSTTLMEGNFASESTFQCCSGSSPVYVSSFSGLLNIAYLDPGLAALLDFNLPATGGSIAQVEIFFGSAPASYGVAFSGKQGGGAIAVTDSPSQVPEPMTLLLLGSSLLVLGVLGRRITSKGDLR